MYVKLYSLLRGSGQAPFIIFFVTAKTILKDLPKIKVRAVKLLVQSNYVRSYVFVLKICDECLSHSLLHEVCI